MPDKHPAFRAGLGQRQPECQIVAAERSACAAIHAAGAIAESVDGNLQGIPVPEVGSGFSIEMVRILHLHPQQEGLFIEGRPAFGGCYFGVMAGMMSRIWIGRAKAKLIFGRGRR